VAASAVSAGQSRIGNPIETIAGERGSARSRGDAHESPARSRGRCGGRGLSLGFGHLIQTADGADTAEVRLRKLEDVEAIRTLLVRYGRELDKRDFAAYGALFAQDGSWKGGMGTATGPEAIAKMVAAGFERMEPSLYTSSNHVMTSFDIDVEGDTATAWSRWTWVVVGARQTAAGASRSLRGHAEPPARRVEVQIPSGLHRDQSVAD
jgi:hypothetical protein